MFEWWVSSNLAVGFKSTVYFMWKQCKQILLFSFMLGLLHNLCLFCSKPGLDPVAPWTSHCMAGSKTTLDCAGFLSRLCFSVSISLRSLNIYLAFAFLKENGEAVCFKYLTGSLQLVDLPFLKLLSTVHTVRAEQGVMPLSGWTRAQIKQPCVAVEGIGLSHSRIFKVVLRSYNLKSITY